MAENVVGVMAIGHVPALALKVVAAHVSGYLNFPSKIIPPLPLPRDALDANRLQYDAGLLLKYLESESLDGCSKVIGVLSVDIFVPIFTHVFGEARQGGNLALVSLFRLGQNPEAGHPSPLGLERCAKVALHELGHLFNLSHCEDENCLMHFSGSLSDLDRLPIFFCRYCSPNFRYVGSHL